MANEPARTVANLSAAIGGLERVETLSTYGRVVAIRGLLVEVAGPVAAMRLGGRLDIEGAGGQGTIPCEIIGFQGDRALAMPFGSLEACAGAAPPSCATRPPGRSAPRATGSAASSTPSEDLWMGSGR